MPLVRRRAQNVPRAIYRTTARAADDIIGIYARGAREFGVDQAERYHQRLIQTFELLAQNPGMAPERHGFKPAIRLYPCGVHLILYRVEEPGILVVRVLHNRRDWIRQL